MNILILAGLAMASAAAPAPVQTPIHSIALQHRDVALEAAYRPVVKVETRQIWSLPSARAIPQCAFTATVNIARDVTAPGAAPVPALARNIAVGKSISGVRPGDCQAASRSIAAEIEQRSLNAREQLRAAAEADRASLVAELESLDQLHPARAG